MKKTPFISVKHTATNNLQLIYRVLHRTGLSSAKPTNSHSNKDQSHHLLMASLLTSIQYSRSSLGAFSLYSACVSGKTHADAS